MLNKLKRDIDKALSGYIDTLPLGKYTKEHYPILYSGIKGFLNSPGKRIRPILFLIAYLGYTKKRNINRSLLIRSALSMELLHAFLLMHDDVIDDSDTRRGKLSLHRFFNKTYKMPEHDRLGYNLSITAGDIVFSMAVKELLKINENPKNIIKAAKIFSDTASYTGLGEYIDIVNDSRKISAITKKDVLFTYLMKTAKYTFSGPLVIGGTLAGAPKNELIKLEKLGSLLGQAFQVQDDLIDIFLSKAETGKPALKDLAECKRTLLMQITYTRLNKKDKKTLSFILDKKNKNKKDISRILDLVISSGAALHCLEESDKLISRANGIISRLKMKIKYRKTLEELSKKLNKKSRILEDRILSCRRKHTNA